MTTIGIFTLDRGVYTGTINMLALNADLVIVPVTKPSEKAPDLKLYIPGTAFDVGVAWKRQSKGGKPFLSVILDDPSFVAPISARLIAEENGEFRLYWSR